MKVSKAKRATVATPTLAETEDLADSIFRESLEAIRKEIRGIANGSIKPSEHDPTSRIAWLAQKAAAVAAEQRKATAAEVKRIGALRYEDVVAYIRQLPRDQRAGLLREMTAIDTGGSVLA